MSDQPTGQSEPLPWSVPDEPVASYDGQVASYGGPDASYGGPGGSPPPSPFAAGPGSPLPPPPGYPGGGYPGGGYPTGPAWPVAALKPGVVPLRPLAVGEILDGAFTTIRRNWRATLGLAAVFSTVEAVLRVAAISSFGAIGTTGVSSSGDIFSGIAPGIAATVGEYVVSAVLSAVLAGMLSVVVSDAVLGRRTTAGEAWARVRPVFWRLMGAALLSGVVPFLGLAFFLVPGVFLWGAWALTTPALVLERTGVIGALRRSWRLTVPDWWRVWGIRALATLLAVVLAGIISTVFGLGSVFSVLQDPAAADAGAAGTSWLVLTLGAIAGIIGGTLTQPFVAGVVTLLYVDRRMRAEGLDITLRQTTLRDPVASRPGPG